MPEVEQDQDWHEALRQSIADPGGKAETVISWRLFPSVALKIDRVHRIETTVDGFPPIAPWFRFINRTNDRPFCGAETGTLKLAASSTSKCYSAERGRFTKIGRIFVQSNLIDETLEPANFDEIP